MVHEGGFTLELDGGAVRVLDPRGQLVPERPADVAPADAPAESPGDARHLEPPLIAWNVIDYDYVVDGLLRVP